jgi:DNA ligase 1
MDKFVQTCDAVAATTKRLEKVRLVAELFQSASVEDASRMAVFLTGIPFPRREERVLGVGGSSLSKLVVSMAGPRAKDLGKAYRAHGDLGDAAEQLLSDHSANAGISIAELAAGFDQIASLRNQAEKLDVLRKLFDRATPGEVKYVIKIMTGDMRIGLKESQVEEAIAKAYERPIETVRRANMLVGDIAETLRLATGDALATATVRLFHPIGFMLAAAVEKAAEVFEEGDDTSWCVEEKFDGIRAQVHKSGDRIRFFSRTLDEIVEFSELREPVAKLPGEFILDGEIIAWHNSRPLPFTELQKRLGRKQPDLLLHRDIPVRFVVFDLLYQNGELLLDMQLKDRRERLTKQLQNVTNQSATGTDTTGIALAPVKMCASAEAIEAAFRESLAAGHEGLLIKATHSLYTPGRRGGVWFKLKEPYATLDVVVTAVEYGHGKRHGVLSDYTFSVLDGDRFVTIGKAYSGLTDAEIKEYTEYFLNHTIEDQGYRRTVEPNIVIEVAFNNMQRSARHASGFALRFPRILRFRPDKRPDQIDTLQRVEEIYAKQITLPRSREK